MPVYGQFINNIKFKYITQIWRLFCEWCDSKFEGIHKTFLIFVQKASVSKVALDKKNYQLFVQHISVSNVALLLKNAWSDHGQLRVYIYNQMYWIFFKDICEQCDSKFGGKYRTVNFLWCLICDWCDRHFEES